MKNILLPIILPLIMAFVACNEPAVIDEDITTISDSLGIIERKQTIMYDNGQRTEIRYLGESLDYGKYKKFDKEGKLIEEGEYINDGFRAKYGDKEVRSDALLGMIFFALFIFVVYLYLKNRQAVIDWIRAKRAGRK